MAPHDASNWLSTHWAFRSCTMSDSAKKFKTTLSDKADERKRESVRAKGKTRVDIGLTCTV